jgi:excisionase family DNA binding protein
VSEPDEILTAQETADLLRVPLATLCRWCSTGTGPPYYRLGRYSRWRRSEVFTWLEAQRADPDRLR